MADATNANTMKEKNRRLIIDLIRKYNLSRVEIAKATSLTKAAVSIIVEDLIKNNIAFEYEAMETHVGRRPLRLKINPDFMHAVGINIDRTYIEMGIVDISGKILCQKKIASSPKKAAFKQMTEYIEKMLSETGTYDSVYGIGVTSPGPVDAESTTILNPPSFDEWHYENIGFRLRGSINKPVCLENISSGFALGEKYFGIAKEMENFLLLIVRDGIGSGVISSGELLHNGAELGHTSIAYDGILCKCGNKGCLERYASIPALLENLPYDKWAEVIDAADETIIEKEAEYLSCALINAVNMFGFDNIIIEGEINYKPKLLIDAVKRRMKKNTVKKENINIYPGSSQSGVLCAAVSVFDKYFKEY